MDTHRHPVLASGIGVRACAVCAYQPAVDDEYGAIKWVPICVHAGERTFVKVMLYVDTHSASKVVLTTGLLQQPNQPTTVAHSRISGRLWRFHACNIAESSEMLTAVRRYGALDGMRLCLNCSSKHPLVSGPEGSMWRRIIVIKQATIDE